MDLLQLADFYRCQLIDDILPFWFPRAIDREYGGYLHFFDRDGSLLDTDKSVWAQGRMAWLLLTLDKAIPGHLPFQSWGEHGLDFITKYCFGPDGHMYFHVDRAGAPHRIRRYAYSEAFASIAFGAHFAITGSANSRTKGIELFRQFLRWNFEPGVSPPKFTSLRPTIGMAPRMITIVTAQELRTSLGDAELFRTEIDRAIFEIENFFVKPSLQCVMESVGPHGEILDHVDARLLNPGHAIEGAWFILREGDFRHDQRLVDLGCQMLDWMWERGWDSEYGGIFYFRDVYNRPVQEYWHDMKFWWPHDETLIATLYAYLLTKNEKYLAWHEQLRAWSFEHFADSEHGEWYGYLHRDGTVSQTAKGNLWKSFFHHPRAMLVCWNLAERAGLQ